MNSLGKCLGLIGLWCCLSGCATQKELKRLQYAQSQNEEFLWQQAEQLRQQNQRLQMVELEKQALLDQLASLQVQLEALKGQTAKVQVAKTASAKSKVNPAARHPEKPIKRTSSGEVVVGHLEWVWFDLFHRSVLTRMDTGMKMSTIYASSIQSFERDGEQWVRFSYGVNEHPETPSADKGRAETLVFEAPVAKRIRIKSGGGDESIKRVVVNLRIKLGDLVDDSQFVLAERSANLSGIVIGRSFLRDIAVVDVAKKFTQPKFSE